MLTEDVEWLRALQGRLWVLRETTEHYNGSAAPRKWWAESGERMTEEELTRLHEVVLRNDLPVEMCNTSFGFGVGMVVREPEKTPVYPGTEEATVPETLAVVSQAHLPPSESTSDAGDRITFDDGWRVFSALTHSDHNREILRRCGLEAPKPKGHYVY